MFVHFPTREAAVYSFNRGCVVDDVVCGQFVELVCVSQCGVVVEHFLLCAARHHGGELLRALLAHFANWNAVAQLAADFHHVPLLSNSAEEGDDTTSRNWTSSPIGCVGG